MTPTSPDSLKDLIRAAVAFRDERDWAQFHSPKELAISLAVESAELIQLMQWFKGEELDRVIREKHAHLKDELADVLFSVLLLADELKIDLGQAFLDKLEKTAAKYPVDKSRGSPKKYTEL
jgi:dCTP diphosphatase